MNNPNTPEPNPPESNPPESNKTDPNTPEPNPPESNKTEPNPPEPNPPESNKPDPNTPKPNPPESNTPPKSATNQPNETTSPQAGRSGILARVVSAIKSAGTTGWNWICGIGQRTKALRPSQPLLLTLLVLILLTSTVMTFSKYFLQNVPSGYMLVKVSMFGEPLSEGQILAGPGQKGVREQVFGEGWHFVWPILFKTELKQNIVVPGQRAVDGVVEPPKVGIVKALGGRPLPAGVFLAERGQQGIWREVLLPGSYRLNPYGFEVKLVDMVEIKPGNVGVLRRKLGTDGPTEFAAGPNEKGIVRDRVLQPGLYPVNTEVYEVISCPVGIYQTTYHYDIDKSKNTALVFDASDSNRIELDCTIEWELQPKHWPDWVAKFRTQERIESAVIKLNVKNISRNRGQDYGAEDFLDGDKREKFQTEFTNGLREECQRDDVVIRHAFIRNIIIRDEFLRPKREEQLAKEKAETQKELTITAETKNDVVAAERTIDLEVAKVDALTQQMVAAIEREASNLKIVTAAEVEKLKDEFAAEIAILESERTELIGKANAESKKTIDTARSALHKMQMDVFENDTTAFMRYTMSKTSTPTCEFASSSPAPGLFGRTWENET